MIDAVFHWSGGKDSSLCLYKVLNSGKYNIKALITTISDYDRISMHGVRLNLLKQQTEAIGIPLDIIRLPDMPDMDIYSKLLTAKLNDWKAKGVTTHIYGDIFLEDLKVYRENQLAEVGCNAVFPLWQLDTTELLDEFINSGFKAVVACCNGRLMDQTWAGKLIDTSFKLYLPKEVDPCGENGEFHSFVYDGPIFNKPINIEIGEVIERTYETTTADNKFWYADILPQE